VNRDGSTESAEETAKAMQQPERTMRRTPSGASRLYKRRI
jgi:hypothetical protein